MWRLVQSKAQQRWLWQAIDHLSGVGLAYAFGSRADKVFVELKKLLRPFGLAHFSTDGVGVYERHLPAAAHPIGKTNPQQVERKHLTLRTRIKRLYRTTKGWHTRVVTLSETKSLSERFFAPLRMIRPRGCTIKCTNVLWSDLARRTLCFSKSVFMPDTVIGLCVNRYEFGTPI